MFLAARIVGAGGASSEERTKCVRRNEAIAQPRKAWFLLRET